MWASGYCAGLDFPSGVNILTQQILAVVGKPSELVLSHPPNHNIVAYCGKSGGWWPHPDDLSRCATEDELLAGEGVYSSYQADLVTRMPKKELAAVLIKEQHNVTSKGKEYPLRLPRIMHEYVVLWEKRRSVAVAVLGEKFVPDTPAL